MERFLQTKGRMGGFIRGMNVVLTLNETALLFPFRGIETLIIKYGTIPRSQLDLLGDVEFYQQKNKDTTIDDYSVIICF